MMVANLRISCRPRVTSPDLALSPKRNPSEIPQAMAITFFSAPPNATPFRSLLG
ncbi:Uncharacterised protein [Chlamydia trachomatis]|nr:Uncharacterised protein [Chlamydia trachomatis]